MAMQLNQQIFHPTFGKLHSYINRMLAKRKYKCLDSSKLYFCKHCEKNFTHKTYLRHAKLFLKQGKESITVDLPPFTNDTNPEEGTYYLY